MRVGQSMRHPPAGSSGLKIDRSILAVAMAALVFMYLLVKVFFYKHDIMVDTDLRFFGNLLFPW